MSPPAAIAVAVFCVLGGGFFVAAKFAILKVRGTRVEELLAEGSRRAGVLKRMLDHLDAYLSTCQVGIALASLGLGWIGGPAVANLLRPLFVWLGITSPGVVGVVSFVIAFGLIAFLHIVVGEQVPKSAALRNPEGWALSSSPLVRAFQWLLFPFVWLVNTSSLGLLRLLRIERATEADLSLSEEEIRMVFESSHESGVLDGAEKEMLDNVFDFGDHTVHEIMVPRTRMNALYADRSFEENLAIIRETKHTRYPLVGQDRDDIIGMVHMKDLYFTILESGGEPPSLEGLKREILAVPVTMRISDLLELFQRKRIHMAVAIDEFGGNAGLITLEDLLEELVGEIEDEFDLEVEDPIVEKGEGQWEVDGDLPIKDLAKLTDQTIDEEDVDSVGGLIMLHLNRIPEQGESLRIGALRFDIVKMEAYRVCRVRVRTRAGGTNPAIEVT